MQPGEISPSAQTSLPTGIYRFKLKGVVPQNHLVLRLATILKSGQITNVHDLPISTDGTVVYTVVSGSSKGPSESSRNAVASAAPSTADEVSAAVAGLFSNYADDYQALSAQASFFRGQFIAELNAAGAAYFVAQAANTPTIHTDISSNAVASATTLAAPASARSVPIGIDATHWDSHSPATPFSWCQITSF